MSKHRRALTPKEYAQSNAYLGVFVGFLSAYLGAEAVLAARPHPIHWLVAASGAALAGGGAYGITLRRRTRRH